MKILLFGGDGQLGSDLRIRAADLNFTVISPVQSEVDIANRDQVLFLSDKSEPDLIINSAAYTNVDLAESEQDQAFKINSQGAANVAQAALESKARLIHISTDYVFDGMVDKPLCEHDPVNPLGVYGKSKLEGEQRVEETLGKKSLIVRTSWLHGKKGHNFVHTMVRLFEEKEVVRVVSDQFGSPTWTSWLAETILDLGRIECHGIVHAACAGRASWFEFAQQTLDLVREQLPNRTVSRLEPQTTEECARPAARPAYSVLDCSRLASLIGRQPLSWQDGLRGHLREIGYKDTV